jgi:hypothetical protein
LAPEKESDRPLVRAYARRWRDLSTRTNVAWTS